MNCLPQPGQLTGLPTADAVPDPLEQDLAGLPSLELDELRRRWRKLTRRPAPPSLRRELLARLLAYEMQVRAYGGLSRDTSRLLDRLARGDDARTLLAGSQERRLRPGTQLVREHAGRLHRVTVTEVGYLWEGTTYASLSEVARAITGTRWNGPRFFGLRDKPAVSAGGEQP